MRLKNFFLPLASIAVGFALTLNTALAQYQDIAAGARGSCGAKGSSTLSGTLFGDAGINVPLDGTATFEWVSTQNDPAAPASATLRAVDLKGSGESSDFGTIEFELDATRDAPSSTITANEASAPLPATGSLSFYLTARVQGIIYESIQPVTLTATLSAWPHNEADYNTTEPVDFQDRDQPGVVVFTMGAGQMPTTVTAQTARPLQ
ncbi:MAG: hypothetical protein ABI876_14505 [Bacteroidota bacterium]